MEKFLWNFLFDQIQFVLLPFFLFRSCLLLPTILLPYVLSRFLRLQEWFIYDFIALFDKRRNDDVIMISAKYFDEFFLVITRGHSWSLVIIRGHSCVLLGTIVVK